MAELDNRRPPFSPIEDVPPLDDNDLVCLQEIRAVLKKHRKIDRFGVTLLHQHFDLKSGEILMETASDQNRSMTQEPVFVGEVERNAVDTSWYLGSRMPLALVKCRTSWHR
jgi:hypothetical protein